MIDPDEALGHVVFDCDGTLISSHEAILETLTQLFEEELGRQIPLEEMRKKYYPQMDILMKNFGFGPDGLGKDDPEVEKRLIKRWSQISTQANCRYALFPEIKELLSACEKENWAQYVWTGRDRVTTLEILKTLGIMPYFYDIRTATDGIPKPHPQGMEDLLPGRDKKRIVLIGDSGADQKGAKNFGCHFIGAAWCNHSEQDAIRKDLHANHPMGCVDLIKSLFK